MTIDRINCDGNYCPENCRWITIQEQQKNKRNVLKIKAFGKEMTVEEACKKYGISKETFYDRRHRGWETERILSTPIIKQRGGYRRKGEFVYHG